MNIKRWLYTVSKNGRHQISEIGGSQVAILWNCSKRNSNAHLIAAAPEMYAMLETALSEMHSLIDEVNDQRMSHVNSMTETSPDLHDGQTLHEIQLLLAKARGES